MTLNHIVVGGKFYLLVSADVPCLNYIAVLSFRVLDLWGRLKWRIYFLLLQFSQFCSWDSRGLACRLSLIAVSKGESLSQEFQKANYLDWLYKISHASCPALYRVWVPFTGFSCEQALKLVSVAASALSQHEPLPRPPTMTVPAFIFSDAEPGCFSSGLVLWCRTLRPICLSLGKVCALCWHPLALPVAERVGSWPQFFYSPPWAVIRTSEMLP